MKKILLKIDDDVIKKLNSYIIARGITGNLGGIADAFIRMLIINIDHNKKEWHCHYKNKEEKK